MDGDYFTCECDPGGHALLIKGETGMGKWDEASHAKVRLDVGLGRWEWERRGVVCCGVGAEGLTNHMSD